MNELAGQQKRKKLLAMLDEGLVMLHLDPRHDGVAVPSQFDGDPVLRLNIAYGFKLPELVIDKDGVYAVLSFNQRNFGCVMPWNSIFAITSPDNGHEGVVWPESVPDELAPFFDEAGVTSGAVPVSLKPSKAAPALEPSPDDEAEAESPLRPLFIVHEGGKVSDQPAEDTDTPPTDPSAPERRPTLTIVKG